eukprot:Hpha_TRINITY_DN26278_c0_g1::TRINITY_DN26278_c0_g1_i1::g.184841::m.184841/K14342/SLC10A2, ASBT; solute carrier family 10 (sodium/bile acid cotransporter), member 2
MAGNTSESGAPVEPDMPVESLATLDIILGLVLFFIMLGVGGSLEVPLIKYFGSCRTRLANISILTGLFCQFVVMPNLGALFAKVFGMTSFEAFGFVCVMSCPGGTTSNIFAVLAKGVLELSVMMTVVSSVLAFGFTTMWLYVYGVAFGVDAAIDFMGLVVGLVLLMIPLVIGAVITYCCPAIKQTLQRVLSIVGAVGIVVVLALVMVDYSGSLGDMTWRVWIPASLLTCPIGGAIAWLICRFAGFKAAVRRTVALEAGLQNSSLAYGIIQLSLRKQSQRDEAVRGPLIYTIFMFVWAGIYVGLSQFESRYNERHNICELNPELAVMVRAIKKEEEAEEERAKSPHHRQEEQPAPELRQVQQHEPPARLNADEELGEQVEPRQVTPVIDEKTLPPV